MILTENTSLFTKVMTSNATDASFPSRIPTTTAPTSNAGIITLAPSGSTSVPRFLILCPYAVGADNVTFKMRVLGWKVVSTLYVPVLLFEATCTASAAVGVSGAAVDETNRFADTIAMTANFGVANVTNVITSPVSDLVAHATVNVEGFDLIEVTFDRNGSATSCNALYATRS